MQFSQFNKRGVAHVIPKGLPKGLAEVLSDFLHTDAPHRADGEGPDKRVRVVGVLHECIHRQQGQLRLRLGVVDQVQVDQLLQLDVV